MDLEPMTDKDLDEATAGNTDFSGVSDEDLDVQISQIIDGDEQEPAQEPVEKPEPEQEPEKAAEPEPEPESAETTPEPASEPTPEQDRQSELEAQLGIFQAKLDKQAAQVEHYRYLADNRAGELDYLRKQGRAPAAPRPEPEREDYGEPAIQQAVPREFAERIDRLEQGAREDRTERITRALTDEAAEFNRRHADFFSTLKRQSEDDHQAFMADVQRRVVDGEKEFESLLYGDNAKLSAKTARMVYEAAMADAREAFYQKRRELIAGRRAAQAEQMKAAKRDAEVTASEPKATPTPSKAKTLAELDDADLDKLIDSEMKKGVYDAP